MLIAMLTCTSANAQEQQPVDTPQRSVIDLTQGVSFEVSPYTALMGSTGAFGLRISMNYSSLNMELCGEQAIGKFSNLYPLSVNALLNFSTRNQLIPYGTAGIGVFIAKPTNSFGDETVTTFGMNFGGGARYYVTKSFGIRFEFKEFVTTVKNDRELKKDILFFQEVSIGASFMFR